MLWTQNVSNLIIAIVTAVASVIAIFISASVSKRAEQENHKRQFLSDAYSNLFTRYAQWLETKTQNAKGSLLAAIEQARLLSSPSTEKLLENFENSITRDVDTKVLGEKLKTLRVAVRTELDQVNKKAYKKKEKKKQSKSTN